MEKLFSREGVTGEEATRGKIGIPCVLNMYENYPFWHRFFAELGFKVVISAKSSKRTFEDGLKRFLQKPSIIRPNSIMGILSFYSNKV